MNIGQVAIKTVVIIVILFLLSLAGAITFPVATAVAGVAGVGIINFILLLFGVFILALVGNTIGKGIRGYKVPLLAIVLVYACSFAIGGLITVLGLLNVPYAPTINITWLGTTLVSRMLTILLIGTAIMVVFLVGE
jgi:hypothetical protein